VDFGEWFVNAMIDAINLGIRTINDIMDKANVFSALGVDAPNIGEIGKVDFTGPIEAAKEARQELKAVVDKIKDDWKGGWESVAQSANTNSGDAWHYWRDSLGKIADRGVNQGGRFETALERAFKGVSGSANREGGDAFGHWRNWLDQTKSMGDSKTMAFKNSVSGNFRSLASASIGAIASLASETQKTLSSLKVKDQIYVSSKGGGGSDTVKAQRGAAIVPGTGSGDKVPALLEPGEVVINRKAAAALGGSRKVNSINSMIPRFAKGGVAGQVVEAIGPVDMPPFQYAADHAGGNRHLHLAMSSSSAIVRFGEMLEAAGYMISGHPHWGAVGSHAPGSYHYSSQAIDINTAADETMAEIRKVVAMLGGAAVGGVGGTAQRLKRMLLEGPAGPLLSGGQSAIDMVRLAANKMIGRNSRIEGAESMAGISTDGPLQSIAQDMITKAWGMGQWAPFNDLVNRESGWNPRAVNPSSGAAGLAQALPPSKYPPGAWPYQGKQSAVLQLQWMIDYIRERYGTPAGAISFHNANNWYQRGGIAKLAGGGAVVGPGGGTGSGSAPWTKLLDRVKRLRGKTPFIEEQIANAQTIASMLSSPAGADLSEGERAGQISLGQKLLSNLTGRASGIGKLLRILPKKDKRRKGLMSELVGLQGITGEGGSILQAKAALDALGASAAGGGIDWEQIAALRSTLLQQANQRLSVSQAQYGAFQGMPSITPTVGNADVRIYHSGDGSYQTMVNGQVVEAIVDKKLRQAGRRAGSPRAGSRGF
jgi:hypothetical protein